jgi:ABC-type cobalamin/Fe3+-siderophores transport system ATPase subunit
MGRKFHYLMETVYVLLSKNGCGKSGLLAVPELTVTLFVARLLKFIHLAVFYESQSILFQYFS